MDDPMNKIMGLLSASILCRAAQCIRDPQLGSPEERATIADFVESIGKSGVKSESLKIATDTMVP